ncbi:MAG: hypothetical protein R2865_05170 [Deinococcales bacterium]
MSFDAQVDSRANRLSYPNFQGIAEAHQSYRQTLAKIPWLKAAAVFGSDFKP